MPKLASVIYTDGPSVDPAEPDKKDIREWGTWVEGIIAAFFGTGGKIYQTKSALTADLVPAANTSAWVMEDPVAANNGVYRKVGATTTGSWVRAGDLPFSFIIANDAGAGTPNAIQATTAIPVSSSALIWLEVADTNTSSPVTISFNGGTTKTIKTNSGGNVATGGLVAGTVVMGILSGSTFRLLSDQTSTAILAAAEAAQEAAEAAQAAAEAARDIALAGVTVPIYSTIDGMTAITIPVLVKTARVNGRTTAGDGKEGTFIRVAADPGSTVSADDKFRSADRFMPDGSTSSGNGGWWQRKAATYAEAKSNQWIPGREFSLPAGYGAGTAAAFNTAMQAVALRGGGEVIVPAEDIALDATLDNKYADVLLMSNHLLKGWSSGGADPFGQGARFLASFAGIMFRHRTPYASEMAGAMQRRNNGGGIKGITLHGNQIATQGMLADSIANFLHDVYVTGIVGVLGTAFAIGYKCGVTGTDVGEAADIQNGIMNLKVRQIDTVAERAVGGIVINGSTNANFSLNHRMDMIVQHWDGTAFYGICADNNRDMYFRSQRVGGTGNAILCQGIGAVPGGPVGFQGNVFQLVSCNAPVVLTGTDTGGITAGVINEIVCDDDNGMAEPTAGTGSKWLIRRSRGRTKGFSFDGLDAGIGAAGTNAAMAARATYTSASIIAAGGSDQDVVLINGTTVWRIYVDTTTKNLKINRVAGTGKLDLGSITELLVAGLQVSYGANDSGGAGFKLLRVPN